MEIVEKAIEQEMQHIANLQKQIDTHKAFIKSYKNLEGNEADIASFRK
jgi:hypothetical protein